MVVPSSSTSLIRRLSIIVGGADHTGGGPSGQGAAAEIWRRKARGRSMSDEDADLSPALGKSASVVFTRARPTDSAAFRPAPRGLDPAGRLPFGPRGCG